MADPRDLKFTLTDFRRVRKMVYQRVGIALNDSKTHMAYSRLARRVRQHGLKRFADYLDMLEGAEASPEWQHFINALTTNLTAFFREPHHFDTLKQHAQERLRAGRPYNVWSSASSTGEEPYSIALTLLQVPGVSLANTHIVASDIDTQVLQHASAGVYDAERVASLAPALLHRFFLRGVGRNEGKVRLKRELRQYLEFYQFNLVQESWPQMGPFDAIFCRNVLIYFDKPTQARILRQMAECLMPDGLLFLGHSENIQHICDAFQPCGRTVYRRVNHD
ncbi:CheR family methyltransferase [uncultured Aquitalea sp.]|uniref:CheR family methyltransferase n=1 Tax=uncultured Aquitalea sp. TaxID=540272 RepID=UPI0025F3A5CE|nr:CheR family methyltransferase [uncultured Aquitalea sp.]